MRQARGRPFPAHRYPSALLPKRMRDLANRMHDMEIQ